MTAARAAAPEPEEEPEVVDIADLAKIAAGQDDGDDIVDAELVDDAPSSVPAVIDHDHLPATASNDAAVAALIPADDEWADVDEGDLAPSTRRIPYLKINRNLDGGFTIPDTGEVVRELDFVWMAKAKSRTWFSTDFSTKNTEPPACRSADGQVADLLSPALQDSWDGPKPTGDCTTCPLASFDEKVRDGAKRCRESVEALVFVPSRTSDGEIDGGQLSRMRWSGIAVRPALDYWSTFSLRMPKIPPIGFLSRAILEPTDTDYGEKLAPRFVRVHQIARAAAQPLIVERDQRVADWKADVLADAREGVDHEADPSSTVDSRNGDVAHPDEEPF